MTQLTAALVFHLNAAREFTTFLTLILIDVFIF